MWAKFLTIYFCILYVNEIIVVGEEEEGEKLGEMNGKRDVRSFCEGKGENFPGLHNLHMFFTMSLLPQAKGNSFKENK